ncbi:hypothetical protein D3C85_494550 [compost metagenome]
MGVYSDMREAIRLGTSEVFTQSGFTVPVIYSHQNGSEPNTAYCVINILNHTQRGRTQTATFTDDGDWEPDYDGELTFGGEEPFTSILTKHLIHTAVYEVVVQFTFAGSDAPDLAHDFMQNICNNVVVTEAYQKQNLAPMRKSNLRRAPQKRDTQWVDYYNIDVTFSYAVRTTQSIDWIEHVSIVESNSGDTIVIPPIQP